MKKRMRKTRKKASENENTRPPSLACSHLPLAPLARAASLVSSANNFGLSLARSVDTERGVHAGSLWANRDVDSRYSTEPTQWGRG